MESLKTPRLPIIRPSLELGVGELCDGQQNISNAKSKIRTFLIDTPLDEALSDRERLWSFQQRHRGVVGKGNFLPNVTFRNKIYPTVESIAEQDKFEHTLPKIGIIEGEQVNNPRRSMIVRPRLKTRNEFYIPHIHENVDDIPGKFDSKRGKSYDDNLSQIEINSEEFASKNVIDNFVDGVLSSRQSITKYAQKTIKHGMHYGGGFCNNQEPRLLEMDRSWTTLTTSDLKTMSTKASDNRRHYCSLTGLNSPEPLLQGEVISDTLINLSHDESITKEERPKAKTRHTAFLTENKTNANKDPRLQTAKSHRNHASKDDGVVTKTDIGSQKNKRSVQEVVKHTHEKDKTAEEKGKGYSSNVTQYSPTGKRIVEEKMYSESKLERGNMIQRNTSNGGSCYETDAITDLEVDNDSTDREKKNKATTHSLLDRGLSDLKLNPKERLVSVRSNSDLSMDWPKDRLGHTTHAVDKKGILRKGSWQYGQHPYRWTDKLVTENDKGWIEKILNRHNVIDETNYDSFARTKRAQVHRVLDTNQRERSFIHSREMK